MAGKVRSAQPAPCSGRRWPDHNLIKASDKSPIVSEPLTRLSSGYHFWKFRFSIDECIWGLIFVLTFNLENEVCALRVCGNLQQ